MNLPCRRCNGTGLEPDNVAIGAAMRERRKQAGVSLRALGARLGLSASYLCDLELGRRAWNAAQITRYEAGLAVPAAKEES